MSKRIGIVVCLLLLAAVNAHIAADDDICEALQLAHSIHRDQLLPYLSDLGRECLKPSASLSLAPTVTAVPVSEQILSQSGSGGDEQIPVSLELTRGLYALNLLSDNHYRGYRLVALDEIVSQPESCLAWDEATFPAALNIERNCRVYATLNAHYGPWHQNRAKRWSATITKESEETQRPHDGDGWSARGRGYMQRPVTFVLDRGIYRAFKSAGSLNAEIWQYTSSPRGCLHELFGIDFPSQFRTNRRCRITSLLTSGYDSEQISSWEYSISKMD